MKRFILFIYDRNVAPNKPQVCEVRRKEYMYSEVDRQEILDGIREYVRKNNYPFCELYDAEKAEL